MFRRQVKKSGQRGAVRMQQREQTTNNFGAKKILLLLSMLVALIIAVRYSTLEFQQTVLPLQEISIDGDFQHMPLAQLQQTIKQNLQGGYFTVDLRRIRQAVLQLPWVEDVSVRRKWPSGLHVEVEEKTAIAYWGESALLSDRGEVFAPEKITRDMALPTLVGPEGLHTTVWQFMTELYDEFVLMGLQIDRLVLDQRRAWQLHLSNGVLVRLGRNETRSRLARFKKVFALHNAPDMKLTSTIDMRYPNGFAILMNKKEDKQKDNMDANNNTHVSEV